MTHDLEIIYHKQMLALTQSPQFFVQDTHILKNAVSLNNPMCGDALCFGYHHHKIHWHGQGCLICLSSAEALCQIIAEYHDNEVIKKICTRIQDYFKGNHGELPEKFLPLGCVKQVKNRIKCAILSTQCVIKLITSL